MTATSYVVLDNDDLGANKIFRAATASALDTNPVSIAQRGTGAPWLNGIGAMEIITTGSGNWTVPAGVYRIKVTAVGAGGGSANGGDTTFSTLTAGGGLAAASSATNTGGTGSGGDVSLPGSSGTVNASPGGSIDLWVSGGASAVGGGTGHGGTYLSTPAGTATVTGGGGGDTEIKVFTVEPGDLLAYSVGAGASAGSGHTASTAGIIIIEY